MHPVSAFRPHSEPERQLQFRIGVVGIFFIISAALTMITAALMLIPDFATPQHLPQISVAAFEAAGLRYYNEAILITIVGSLPIRVSRSFPAGRKLGKSHQNLLVFVKGDWKKAAEACADVA